MDIWDYFHQKEAEFKERCSCPPTDAKYEEDEGSEGTRGIVRARRRSPRAQLGTGPSHPEMPVHEHDGEERRRNAAGRISFAKAHELAWERLTSRAIAPWDNDDS